MIEVSWITVARQDAILFSFPPIWSWKNFHQAQQKVLTMLEYSTTKFPIIFDFRHANDLPPGMIKEMRDIIEAWHPNGSPLMVVGGDKIIENAFNVAARMLNESQRLSDIIFVDSLSHAENFLQARA